MRDTRDEAGGRPHDPLWGRAAGGRPRGARQLNVTVCEWLASVLDSFDTFVPPAMDVTSAAESSTECVCVAWPLMSRLIAAAAVSFAAVMMASCPRLLETSPTLSAVAAGVGVGVWAGVGVGVDGEYDEPPQDSVIVITTPLRAAS